MLVGWPLRISSCLKVACQKHKVCLYIYHISCERMITTGVGGRSRGDLVAGVLIGHDMRQYLHLVRGAFDLAGAPLEKWCKGWMGNAYSKPLGPVGWFREEHQRNLRVCPPPPAAALVAMKQQSKAWQKRPHRLTHVFVCQRLL